ncbi:hypothetical protein [Ferruginibacter albus]|uniref:hypothetical protein n=1 Tax=Ferruginibacter albus TaxID=2875540 RepID=UPI001CC69BD1|nr:hypothetical protein [Ferruginibacter albus]UAY53394.1 hypothetical protein K9M53_06900 [Ferruginibacter albus]
MKNKMINLLSYRKVSCFIGFILSVYSLNAQIQQGSFGGYGTVTFYPTSNQDLIDSLKWEEQPPLINQYENKKIKQILYQRSTDRVIIFLTRKQFIETNKESAVSKGIIAEPKLKEKKSIQNNSSVAYTSVKLIDINTDSPLYTGIVNYVQPTGIDSTYTLLNTFGGFKESTVPGQFQITPVTPGEAMLVVHKKDNDKTRFVYHYKVKRSLKDELNPEPEMSIGRLTGTHVEVSLFKQQAQINLPKGYTFKSAVVYFSGTGFMNVFTTTLIGSSLTPAKDFIDVCLPGSVITFDNVKIIDSTGKEIIINGISYVLTDNNSAKISTTDDSMNPIIYPQFPGGANALNAYLSRNLKYDKEYLSMPIKDRACFLNIKVSEDGTPSVINDHFLPKDDFAKKCLALIMDGPKWIPANYNGKNVDILTSQYIDLNARYYQ